MKPTRKKATKIVAFSCIEEDEGTGGIVFAKTNAQARSQGAGRHNGGEWDGLRVRREPRFDHYASLGHVPDLALWKDGWYFECHCCYRRIDDDFGCDLDERQEPGHDEPVGAEPVDYKGSLYCTHGCVNRSIASEAEKAARELQARKWASKALPSGCVVTRGFLNSDYEPLDQGWPRNSRHFEILQAEFSFPGSVHRGTWRKRLDDLQAQPEISVTRGDLLAWYAFTGVEPPTSEVEDLQKSHDLARRYLQPTP